MSKKLHLGCGSRHLDGFINIDQIYQPGVDMVGNVRFLRQFTPGEVSVIYACHVLEHFSRWDYKAVLKRWYELLGPGGKLYVCVPDFDAVVQHYAEHQKPEKLIGLLYGGQDYEGNTHHYTWTLVTLSKDLWDAGFRHIEPFDWRKGPNPDVDDFSKAYLDKRLMSLNVCATK